MASTSITQAEANKFRTTAKNGQRLQCDKNPGFHLYKIGNEKCSWRYRYLATKDDGEKAYRVKTLGKYPALKPVEALEIYKLMDGTDPLANEREQEREKELERKQRQYRIMRAFLDGPYTRYQKSKRGGAETISRIKNNFSSFLDRDMATFNKQDVRAWQEERKDAGNVQTTIARAYSALKTMLNYAVSEHEILSDNPLKNVKLLKPSDDELEQSRIRKEQKDSARRLLTDKELDSIYKGLELFRNKKVEQRNSSRAHGKPHLPDFSLLAYPHWFEPFCYLAMYTGARPGDLYSLRWSNIDLRFNPHIKYIPNKTMHHPDPAEVILPLSSDILEVLKKWHNQNGKPKEGLVFPRKGSPTQQHDKNAHEKPWNEIKTLGGVNTALHFYALRHHFISQQLANGDHLMEVARRAGHKSAAMIEKHYGHVCPSRSQESMDKFAASLRLRA